MKKGRPSGRSQIVTRRIGNPANDVLKPIEYCTVPDWNGTVNQPVYFAQHLVSQGVSEPFERA